MVELRQAELLENKAEPKKDWVKCTLIDLLYESDDIESIKKYSKNLRKRDLNIFALEWKPHYAYKVSPKSTKNTPEAKMDRLHEYFGVVQKNGQVTKSKSPSAD